MPARLTQQNAELRFHIMGFKLDGIYDGLMKRVKLQCIKCDHVWFPIAKTILVGGVGCPECNRLSKLLTLSSVEQRLYDSQIHMVGNYISTNHRTTFRCKDGHMWNAMPTSILHNGTGCPTCAGNQQYTFEQIQHLLPSGISLVGRYNGMNTKTSFECEDGHRWQTIPSNLIHHRRKCPVCYPYTHNKDFGRRVVIDDVVFRSQLEADCYSYISSQPIDFVYQYSYPTKKRWSCDFFLPKHSMWIEVSSFKNQKYLSRIKEKQRIVENMRHRFFFVPSLNNFRTLISHQLEGTVV